MQNRKGQLKDEDARKQIIKDLDKNILVEAGAGSGKTYNLVKRMASLVLEQKCPVENIAAVTFTRKAAAELKERFQGELEKAYHRSTQPLDREQLNTALMNLDSCFVGTIHSFCAKLLKERPVEAGIDPEFEELDDVENSKLVDDAWQEYILQARANDADLLAKIGKTDITPDELRSFFHTIIDYPEVEIEFAPDKNVPDFEPALQDLQKLLKEAFPYIPDPPHEDRHDALQDAILQARRLLNYLETKEPVNAVKILTLFKKAKSITQKLWVSKEEAKDLKNRFDALTENAIAPVLQQWREYCHHLICKLLLPGREFMIDYKNRCSALSFHDLLHKSAEMLRESPEVRQYFQGKYRCLLIDEFQDTDPLQAEIMLYLTGADTTEKNWHNLVPLPGSLFVVGDPKQSIFRFRRADIDTYNMSKTLIIESGGEVLQLTTNFRCLRALGEFCNEIFRALLAAEENEYQALFSPVDARRDNAPGTDYGVRLLKTDKDLKKKDDIVPADARNVACFIRQAVDGNINLDRTPEEKKAGLDSTPQPRDFLIILRVKEMMDVYARALEAEGIPVTMSGGSSLSDSPELAELLKLLQCLNDPDNKVTMAAVLRGLLFGISDDELYRYKAAGGSFSLFAAFPQAAEEDKSLVSVTGALAKIKHYLDWKKQYPPPVVLEKIIDHLGLVPYTLSRPLGERDCSYLYQVLEYVRQGTGDTAGGDPFNAMVTQVESLISAGLEEELELDTSGRNTVRLMNLHKAKGLEAPVVILANPVSKQVVDISKVKKYIVRKALTPVGYFGFFRPKGEYYYDLIASPPGWDDCAAEELKYLQAEENRLIYVAATRAKNLLVISASDNTMNNSAWQALLKNHDTIDTITLPDLPQPAAKETKEAAETDDLEQYRDHLEMWTEEHKRPGYSTARPSGISKTVNIPGSGEEEAVPEEIAVTAAAHRWEEVDYTSLPDAAEKTTEDKPEALSPEQQPPPAPSQTGGITWGNVMHTALEALVKGKADLKDIITQALRENNLSAGLADKVQQELANFQKTDIWKDIEDAPEKHAEIPFSLHIDKEHPLHAAVKEQEQDQAQAQAQAPGSDKPVLLSGIIDLAYKTAGGWIIADYKTDRAPDEETLDRLAQQYAPQLHIYARAWQQLTGQEVKGSYLFFLTPGVRIYFPFRQSNSS